MKPPSDGADAAAWRHDAVIDPLPQPSFDALTTLAAKILDVPVALVCFVDTDSQSFTSRHGSDAAETPHDVALFCGHVVAAEAPLVVPDVLQDARFSDLPLVTGDPPARSYAGVPLRTPDGLVIGAFCAIGYEPRQLTESEVATLTLLAGPVVEMLELQRRHTQRAHNLRDELVRREAWLAELEPHRQWFDLTRDLLCTVNSSLHFEQLNPAWEEVLGWTLKDLRAHPFSSLVHPDDLENTETVAARLVADDSTTVINFTNRYRHENGSWVPLAWIARSRNGVVYCAARDISSHRRAEKLKSEFVSTVSHELRTPLTTIRGALGLVAKGITGPLPEQAQEYVDIALANSERLVRLINDILDIEKIQSASVELNLRPVDLAGIIEKAVEENSSFTDSLNVTLAFVERVPDIEVLVDEGRLTQVLTNLISNAAEFSSAGQSVEISMVENGAWIRVQVRDHGRGISEEFRSRIFERFAQEDSSDSRRKGGTGLGLYLSKALIEGMQGTMGFESVPDHVTTFYFDLPYVSAVRDSAVRSERVSEDCENRVLVCGDDFDVARVITRRLETEAGSVHVAATFARARELLGAFRYRVVIIDPTLTDGEASSLISEVNRSRINSDVAVIVISGPNSAQLEPAGQDSVVVIDVGPNPVDEERLVNAVRGILTQTKTRIRVLHVEDDRDLQQIVKRLLPVDWEVTNAMTVAEASALLGEQQFDLVLLDLALPDGGGETLLDQVGTAQVVIFSASEAKPTLAERVTSALVKSRTTEFQLRDHVMALMATQIDPRTSA